MAEGPGSPPSRTVDLLLRVAQALAIGDLERWLALHDPVCRLDLSGLHGWDGDTAYEGHDGVRRFRAAWSEAFDDYSADLEQLIELDDERFVLLLRHRGRRSTTGERFDEPLTVVGEARAGRMRRADGYSDRDDAMRAAGLA